jgi:hypothetical protein
MILLNKRNFTNILYEVYKHYILAEVYDFWRKMFACFLILIKDTMDPHYIKVFVYFFPMLRYYLAIFRSTNTQFQWQYKQTLLYSVDPLCLLLRLGNKQTFPCTYSLCVHKIYLYTCKHEISYKLQLCSNNIKVTDN